MTTIQPMIEVGKHYVVGEKMRWVLAVANDHVIYSRGGDSHLECHVKTFSRWLKTKSARGQKLGDAASMKQAIGLCAEHEAKDSTKGKTNA